MEMSQQVALAVGLPFVQTSVGIFVNNVPER